MKKFILSFLLGTISTGLVADEKIVAPSPWQKVKTALTSKPAKIIYGSLAIAAIGVAWYIKKVEVSFNELIDGKGLRGRALFFADYNLGREHFAIEHTQFGDGYRINYSAVPEDEREKMERRFWKMARDGRLLNLMPFNDIKVNLVMERNTPILVIRTYQSVCG